jgi:hypothetical protein
MKNKITLNHLKFKNIVKFMNFIKNNHYKNHILAKNKKVINWFYRDKKKLNFIVALKNNDILGVQGFIPFSKFDKKIKKICFLSYWRVKLSKEVGIGLRLFHMLKKQNYDFLGVLGLKKSLLNYHRWQGFKTGKLNHHFFINGDLKKKTIIKNNFIVDYKKIKTQINLLNKKNINFIDDNIFKFQFPEKTKKYLTERYLKNDFYQYKLYNIKSTQINLILVLRVIKVLNIKILKLVDLIGDDININLIGSSMQKLLKKHKAEYLDFYSYGVNKKKLELAGFLNRWKTNEIIPDHFEPYENKNIDIYYGFITKTKKRVRFFKGDGDMDRPSIFN